MDHLIILSVAEVSAIMKKSQKWVYNHAGELGASRVGGSWIFTQEGLIDALERGKRVEGCLPGSGNRQANSADVRHKKRSRKMGAGHGHREVDPDPGRHGL